MGAYDFGSTVSMVEQRLDKLLGPSEHVPKDMWLCLVGAAATSLMLEDSEVIPTIQRFDQIHGRESILRELEHGAAPDTIGEVCDFLGGMDGQQDTSQLMKTARGLLAARRFGLSYASDIAPDQVPRIPQDPMFNRAYGLVGALVVGVMREDMAHQVF